MGKYSTTQVKKETRGRPPKNGGVGKPKAKYTYVKGQGAPISKKPPREPKEPLNALDLFRQERTALIKSTQPDVTDKQILSMVQNEWLDMDEEEQEVWLEKEDAAAEKYKVAYARYEARKKKYEAGHGDLSDDSDEIAAKRAKKVKEPKGGKKKKAKKERDPNMPKKGLNPYMFYSQKRTKEIRAKDLKIQQKDALRVATAEWNSMTTEQKQPYLDMAARDKERHAAAMKVYLASKGQTPKEEKEKPPKKGLNPYMFFSRERVKQIRASNPNIEQKVALREATAQWNSMSDEQKKPYLEMAARDKQRHDQEYISYLSRTGASLKK